MIRGVGGIGRAAGPVTLVRLRTVGCRCVTTCALFVAPVAVERFADDAPAEIRENSTRFVLSDPERAKRVEGESKDAFDRLPELGRIARRDERRAVSRQLAKAAGRARDERNAGGERF